MGRGRTKRNTSTIERAVGKLVGNSSTTENSHTVHTQRRIVLGLVAMLALSLAGCLKEPAPRAPLQPDKTVRSDASPYPTLADFWQGDARFVVDVEDTGLPLGESDTVLLSSTSASVAGGEPHASPLLRSYIHASDQSAGVRDRCGDPVSFPGCVVVMESLDGGRTFEHRTTADGAPICEIACRQCPCDSRRDQIDQQQYPQVVRLDSEDHMQWTMVYEYRANVMVRRSTDGLAWTAAEEVPLTGIWADWLMPCAEEEQIGEHPYSPSEFDCLVGSPPGLTLAYNEVGEPELFTFVGLGRNPGHMGCYRGAPGAPAATWRKCKANPLFAGSSIYGPGAANGIAANPYFDFRTISSADVLQVDDLHYMLYEGIRGPGAGDAGDTQFGLGLARSLTDQIDGPWETFPGNPILVDVPANVGLGHADLIVLEGQTFLYTSLDGKVRSRLTLVWNN
jgi:hypothetical protein